MSLLKEKKQREKGTPLQNKWFGKEENFPQPTQNDITKGGGRGGGVAEHEEKKS